METNSLTKNLVVLFLAAFTAVGCSPQGSSGPPGPPGERGPRGSTGAPGRSFDITDKVTVSNDVPADDIVSVRCPDDHPYVLHGTCLINWEFAINGEAFLPETDDDNEGWACGAGAIYVLPYDAPTHDPAVLRATVVCVNGS